jgi:uncharacterized protein (DUF305 family)
MRHALLSASTLGASTRQRMPSAVRHLTIVIGLGIALPACSSKDAAKTDSSAAATPVAAAAPAAAPAADTSAHAAATGMGNMAMTGNPDQDFLRMMSDHHKGLIAMVHLTVESKDKITTKPIAARLDKMVTMLEKDFKDPYAPKMMPDNQAMLDELKGKTGAEFDKTFLTNIIKHHEGALKMIDEYLPKAKSPAIKAMAEKMKAVQSKEIAEFQAKLAK